MVPSHLGWVIMFVAGNTAECRKIIGRGMAFDALTPLIFVFPAINWEILLVMVEGRRIPSCSGVAVLAACWEPGSGVIRVGGRIVFRGMATKAGAWGIVIIAVVAGGTIICNCSVCARQCPIIVVYRKGSRLPIGHGGMTHCTIGR